MSSRRWLSAAHSKIGSVTRFEGLAWALLVLALVAIVGPAFLHSDNVNADQETVAYDRIALSLRTFWADQPRPEGLSLPSSYRPDPNFPLGTAALFALPYSLGIDPVLGSRLLTLSFALLAALALGLLVAACADGRAGVLAAAAIWAVPAFTRNAIVSGEAAPYTAALMGSAAVLAWELRRTTPRRGRLLLAGALLGCSVLFRLDAFALAPVWIVAAALLFGRRAAGLVILGVSPPFLLHLYVSLTCSDSAFGFAATATRVTRQHLPSGDEPLLRLIEAAASQLSAPVTLLAVFAAGVFATGVLRRDRRAHEPRLLVGLLLAGTIAAYMVMVSARSMDPTLHRYLVPLFALSLVSALLLAWGRDLSRFSRVRRWLLMMAVCALLVRGGAQSRAAASEVRLPESLPELAAWIGQLHPQPMVRVSGFHPELVVLSGRSERRIQPLHRDAHGGLDVAALAEEQRREPEMLLFVFSDEPLFEQWQVTIEGLFLEQVHADENVVVFRSGGER